MFKLFETISYKELGYVWLEWFLGGWKKKKKVKNKEKMDESSVWLGGGKEGERKWLEPAIFPLTHKNSITPNWGENTKENKSLIFEQNYPRLHQRSISMLLIPFRNLFRFV